MALCLVHAAGVSPGGPARSPVEMRISVPVPPVLIENAHVESWHPDQTRPVLLPVSVASPAEGVSVLTFRGDCLPGRLFVLHGGVVSEPFEASDDLCAGREVRPRVFRAAVVHGHVRNELHPRATRAALGVRKCGAQDDDRAAPWIGRPYPVLIEEGAWRGSVPAECLGLTLRVDPYVPIHWTDVALRRGATVHLGTRALLRPASLTVRVHGNGRPLTDADVYLIDEPGLPRYLEALFRERRLTGLPHAVTGEDGAAALAHLEPGLARVCVVASSYAPACTDPQALEPGGHALVGPIELLAPGDLRVFVDRGASEPRGLASLFVTATPVISGYEIRSFDGVDTGLEGDSVLFEGLAPGVWKVGAAGVFEGGLIQRFAQTEVMVMAGTETATRISLAGTMFAGRILHAGLPARGRVELVPMAQSLEVRQATESDDEGVFEVALPGPGEYHVLFSEADGAGVTGVALNVLFQPGQIVDVRLAEGVVTGTIVDGDGQGVPDARVRLGHIEFASRPGRVERVVRSDPEGRFRLTGVAHGRWVVQASDHLRSSEPQSIQVSAGPGPDVRLVLKETVDVIGTVLGAAGEPVAGVTGYVLYELPSAPELTSVSEFRTNTAGEFVARAPFPLPSHLNVQVFAQERGTAAFRIPLTDRFAVRLPVQTGSVLLQFPAAGREGQPPAWHVLVNQDGAVIALNLALDDPQSAVLSRGTTTSFIALPHLAPGQWRLYPFTAEDRVPWFLYGRHPQGARVSFAVGPGERRTIQVQ